MVTGASDVCQIIEACGKSNVRLLKYHDLEIQFGDQTEHDNIIIENGVELVDNNTEPHKEESIINKKEQADFINETLEDLVLTDPLEFEQSLEDPDNTIAEG